MTLVRGRIPEHLGSPLVGPGRTMRETRDNPRTSNGQSRGNQETIKGQPTGNPETVVRRSHDNQAAIKIAENLGVTGRNKHFIDAIHYFRHSVDHGVILPTFVRTVHQCADGFTKALGKGPFRDWCKKLLDKVFV